MAWRRYGRRRYRRRFPIRKRRWTPRRKWSKRRRSVWGPVTGFPATKYVHLRYVDNKQVNFGGETTALANYFFRCNSCYDPDYALGGHQPCGWDQISAQYEHYVVHKSKITVTWTSQGGTSVDQCIAVGTFLTNTPSLTGGTTGNLLIENGKTSYKTLSAMNQLGRGVRTVQWFGAKKAFGVKNVNDNIDSIGAAVGNNPSQDYYFCIWADPNVCGAWTSGAGYIVNAQVQIDYYVSLHEKVQLDAS